MALSPKGGMKMTSAEKGMKKGLKKVAKAGMEKGMKKRMKCSSSQIGSCVPRCSYAGGGSVRTCSGIREGQSKGKSHLSSCRESLAR